MSRASPLPTFLRTACRKEPVESGRARAHDRHRRPGADPLGQRVRTAKGAGVSSA